MVWQLSGISVQYDNKAAIRDISCTIQEGKWISVIGQTGAGKSTFAKVLKGLIPVAEGDYLIDGQPVRKDTEGQFPVVPDIGYVFQYPEHQLFETTVAKELAFGPKHQGLSQKEIRELMENVLPELGLSNEILELPTFQLSGGLKRRVAIASILMMNPRLLIVDEPTAGLDPVSRVALLNFLKQWQRQNNRSLLFISHHMDDVAEFSDEVFLFHDGTLMGGFEPQDLFINRWPLLETLGLSLPEPVQLLKLVEELCGQKIEVASCRERDIFEGIMPFLRAGSSV